MQPQLTLTSCTTVYYFRFKGPSVLKTHSIKGYRGSMGSTGIHWIAEHFNFRTWGILWLYCSSYVFPFTFVPLLFLILVPPWVHLLLCPCTLHTIFHLPAFVSLSMHSLPPAPHQLLPEIFCTSLRAADQNVSSSIWIWCQWQEQMQFYFFLIQCPESQCSLLSEVAEQQYGAKVIHFYQ